MNQEKGEWVKVRKCVECKQRLSYYTMMHSQGTCPKCGNTVDGSIVDATETSEWVPNVEYRIFRGLSIATKRFINWLVRRLL